MAQLAAVGVALDGVLLSAAVLYVGLGALVSTAWEMQTMCMRVWGDMVGPCPLPMHIVGHHL